MQASQLIKSILQEIFVQATEQDIQAPDFNTALLYTNLYMQQLNAQGVSLGWTDLKESTDTVTVPEGAILGIIYNVALQLANQYDVNVNPLLIKNANDSMSLMEQLGVNVEPSSYGDTLPIGGGNYNDGFDYYE